MKIKKYLLSASFVTLMISAGFSQTVQQRKQIVQNYDLQKLNQLSTHLKKVSEAQRAKAFKYAKAHDIPFVVEDANGNKSYLVKMDRNGTLIYYKSFSLDQAKTISANEVYPGGGLDLALEGEGMTGGVWDGGKVRGSHELLEGKVTQKDNASEYDDHATHVSGIFVGKKLTSGQAMLAQGIAYKADLDAYDWFNDLSEMSSAAQAGLLVSNHSYGIDLDQVPDPSSYFGEYGPKSKNTDNIAYLAPNYTIVNAAGNDRNAGYNPGDGGYNLLAAEMSTSKNDIVVAAVEKVLDYTDPSSVEMSGFSSWGPTNDRRIKPDISADGVGVFSSVAHDNAGNVSNDSYSSFQGTSMAAPSVAGGVLLLQELSADLNDGDYLLSATVRALIIETARETGLNDGPDPQFGWGLLNVAGAAQLMVDDHNDAGSFYDELDLSQGDTYTKEIKANGDDLKVTIAWTDPAGDVQNNGDESPVLINDLDLRIMDSEGNTYYPWRLHPFNNNSPALNDDDNDVDNVEQILVPDAVEGEHYTVEVTHKGNLKYGHQNFSIAALGTKPLAVKGHTLKEFSIYPNPATNHFNLDIHKSGARVDVAVFDLNGRQVIHKEFTGNGHVTKSVDVSGLTGGVYFVKIETNGKEATKKLIVR